MKAFSLKTLVGARTSQVDYREAKGNLDKLTWTWMKRSLKWALIRAAFLYGVPIGVAWLAAVNNQGEIAFAAGAFVAVLVAYGLLSWIWRKLRSLFQEPAKEPLVKMFELQGKMVLLAYNELTRRAHHRAPSECVKYWQRLQMKVRPGILECFQSSTLRSPAHVETGDSIRVSRRAVHCDV